jgi:acetyl esterase/lipase
MQLDEHIAVAEWLQGEGEKERNVSSDKVMGGSDGAERNMTAAVSLRLRDEGRKPLATQILLYPEARLPLDTDAASENNTGLYLECEQSHRKIVVISYPT